MAWLRAQCNANGIEVVYVRTGGTKPPVVLLHGLMGSGATWVELARALEADYDVIMPDARGHGGSSKPAEGYRYDDLARDVLGLVDALGLQRPFVLGHSMGGMTAAVVASLAGERLGGVVLVDPTFLEPDRQREVYASDVAAQHREALTLDKATLVARARARNPGRALDVLELQAEARLATAMAAMEVLAPPNPDYRELMRAITIPTMLVTADASPVVTRAVAAELRTLAPALCVEEIRDCGHAIPFEQPEQLAAVVRAFLSRTGPSVA